jgi:hypothetical protein
MVEETFAQVCCWHPQDQNSAAPGQKKGCMKQDSAQHFFSFAPAIAAAICASCNDFTTCLEQLHPAVTGQIRFSGTKFESPKSIF